MKIDRLYAITLHLLNHGRTPASELAKKLEVSVRTVQRDVDALCRAGVPIAAQPGALGGYYLTDTFHLDRQLATREDYSFIRTALKGFFSATDDPKIAATLEKFMSMSRGEMESIVLDFSVLRESDGELLRKLQSAVQDKASVCFYHTNMEGVTAAHTVEPVALLYRWYAWYLLAYCAQKNDYRTYKLVRMEGLKATGAPFTRQHPPAEEILREREKHAQPAPTAVVIRCAPRARAQAIEYLHGRVTQECADGACEMLLQVMEKERFWFGALLSFGDEVEVLEPPHIRQRLLAAAKKIASLYKKP